MNFNENLDMYVTLRLKISDATTLSNMVESDQSPRDVFNDLFEMEGYEIFDDNPNHIIAVEVLRKGIVLIDIEAEEAEGE